MREKILVDLLQEKNVPMNIKDLSNSMGFSESTIRNEIKYINNLGNKNGFRIKLIRGQGYVLDILDKPTFKMYKKSFDNEIDPLDSEQRLEALLFHILQANGYITIEELMEITLVSRSTVSKDLKEIEKDLFEYNLTLSKRPHYGLKVEGKEQDLRRAFSRYVLHSNLYLEPTKNYKEFTQNFETEKLSEYLQTLLFKHHLNTSEVVFKNLLVHLEIIIYRASQNNFIRNDHLVVQEIDKLFLEVSQELSEWIKTEFQLTLPKEETHFLAAHISAKTSTTEMNPKKKELLFNDLKSILEKLDSEFLTNFSQDNELIEGLLMHIYPLLARLYYNMQLENPLIDELKVKYTNVFVVAFRLGEEIEKKYGYTLTRDEVGYIALHLAAYFEREKQQVLEKVKRIVVICSTGGGSAHLIRLKLEKVFPEAMIMTVANKNLQAFKKDLPDLFLSTIPLENEIDGVPVIQIKNFLDEYEIKKIIDKTALHVSEKSLKSSRSCDLQSLFQENYFQIIDSGDYLGVIREQAKRMVADKVASEDFAELVMEREEKFSTIYEQGVAGPHPIRLTAKENTIGVTIFKNPIVWGNREVRIIFLINLKQGHLFLHKEISKLLTQLMENESERNRLLSVKSFEEFLLGVKKLM
jgi:lichenan operon transcriptional antiterminator